MFNLKPYFDAAQAANAEVLRVANEIDGAFTLGTEEGVQEAMGRREELENAQAKAKAAEDLYQSMRAAAQRGESSEAARFTPVNEDAAKQAQGGKKTVTRAEYEAMAPAEKHAFFTAGGQVVDEAAE